MSLQYNYVHTLVLNFRDLKYSYKIVGSF